MIFQPLEVVHLASETQPQVAEKLKYIKVIQVIKFYPHEVLGRGSGTHLKVCLHNVFSPCML